VEVSLGSFESGLGDIKPDKPEESIPVTAPPVPRETVEENIVTQDTEEAPAVETTEEETIDEPIVEEQPDPVEEIREPEPQVDPRALYKGKSKEAREQPSEGISGGTGDEGAPGGDVDTKKYLGKGGFGDGPDWSLEGREPKYLPKPAPSFSENGTVAVQITVNKYCKVIRAVAIDKGSNTTNAQLRRLAEEAARKAIFNANPNAAEMQRGTITYHFIIKN
jgi:TonB family protein